MQFGHPPPVTPWYIYIYILELALYASAYKIARLVRRCLWSKVHRTRWFLTSDLDIAFVHFFPNCLVAVSTTACSEKKLAVIVDVAGLVSASLPRAPVCHNLSDRTSCIFLLSILNLAPSSNLRHINRIEFRGCFWSRFGCRFWTWLKLRACFWSRWCHL